jgi:hypothetical protein
MNRSQRSRLLSKWARLLGWPGLSLAQHDIPGWVFGRSQKTVLYWYEHQCKKTGILFQVNEMPTWHACVYAMRYRICTGWHVFKLSKNPAILKREADRLAGFLSASWFLTLEGRRLFRAKHPECSAMTWNRIHREGFPYSLWSRRIKRGARNKTGTIFT